MHPAAVAGFLAAILPLIVTPGASLTLLTQRVGADGPRSAIPVVLGTATGLYVHAVLAAAGLSALVMRSSEVFAAVRYAGAAYLVGLGLWSWRAASARRTAAPARRRRTLPWVGRSAYPQALLGNLLNPKAASIFLTLVPQFVDPRRPLVGQVLVLATAQVLLIALWLLGWTVVIGRAARVLRSRRFRTALDRTTGTVLVALGLRTALT
ncbi:LysE family translocator [Micromonospora sp. NPDC049559]|uniref:LysE family translocator n=1 Tax=Micromonospora sp. NPDC049559 TaxID=3155923 RepID=UPI00342AEC8C